MWICSDHANTIVKNESHHNDGTKAGACIIILGLMYYMIPKFVFVGMCLFMASVYMKNQDHAAVH